MNLILEYKNLSNYLLADKYVDFNKKIIQNKVSELFSDNFDEIQKIKVAFEYVRDEISHSWDIQSKRVTRTASEVLKYKEGICYAKSMLLAALLRCQGIPTGFCYQRLTLGDIPETGYCIHALNAVFLSNINKWIRIDTRGNTNGRNAQFLIDREQLAFPIRAEYDEVDYPTIFAKPIKITTQTLEDNTDCIEMIKSKLPTSL
ncbi:transglutaminase-like domain-containing protein [Clostridium autoethanogenum]|uniref:Transglutaminase family protein n=1 Tax=Clostridium autoethanogenum DSM 10061 TaxID=1341692 RepID=A0ABM5NSP3_9CLOT|nr:transglutaminase family protein [Clostridium autoethanogenum]AGY75312.1 transglutaminase family protein [Clostridium autoethanogenum DSM 10061]ALU35478.1 Transglutaminase domain-containing protein [Clostridium autoethanogenum DSM 10061]OVY48563.1 Transglutaminase-like superfamily protein [Clostridium autoethanogenum]